MAIIDIDNNKITRVCLIDLKLGYNTIIIIIMILILII